MISQALANHDIEFARRYLKEQGTPDISHLPGDRGLPWLGHMPALLKNAHALMNRGYAKYGKVFTFSSPLRDGIFMLGPEANELLLKNEDKLFSNFLAWDITFANIFDNNVLEMDFSGHKGHRKILQMAFKRASIEGHIEIMNPQLASGLQDLPLGVDYKLMPFI